MIWKSNDKALLKGLEKNVCFLEVLKIWVGRLVGKKLDYFSVQKCVFYACFMLIGNWETKKQSMDFLKKNSMNSMIQIK